MNKINLGKESATVQKYRTLKIPIGSEQIL